MTKRSKKGERNMSTNSMIYKEEQDGTLKGIYCHYDGYLEHNGAILLADYSDPDKLEKLLALGDISYLGSELEKSEDDCNDSYTIAYHRDYGEELKPLKIVTPEEREIGKKSFSDYYEYIYIQDKNGVWYVNSRSGDKFFNGLFFERLLEEMVTE